jgi:hypothetical protein
MWSDNGQFLGYRGTASDITARKRTEAALLAALASARALNQRQKDLAELGADWFWETDANHRFVAMWGGRGSDQVAMRNTGLAVSRGAGPFKPARGMSRSGAPTASRWKPACRSTTSKCHESRPMASRDG